MKKSFPVTALQFVSWTRCNPCGEKLECGVEVDQQLVVVIFTPVCRLGTNFQHKRHITHRKSNMYHCGLMDQVSKSVCLVQLSPIRAVQTLALTGH